MAECSALILAGGGSHRMGDAKALLDRLGEPQINYLCRTVAAHCSALWVSSGAEPKLPVGLAGRWILDGQLEGPLRALYSAIDRIETPLLHLLAVDFPRWSPANLDALCAGLGAHDAAVPRRNGQRVTLCSVLRVDAVRRQKKALQAERRLGALFDSLDVREFEENELPDPNALLSCNTRAEWDQAMQGIR